MVYSSAVGRFCLSVDFERGWNPKGWRGEKNLTGQCEPVLVKQPRDPVTSDTALQRLRDAVPNRMAALRRASGGRMPRVVLRVQQRVPGKTLEELYNDKHPRAEKEVGDWAVQCCKILKSFHEFGLIHRGISPDNLMFTHAGDITVIDLGPLESCNSLSRRHAHSLFYLP